MKKLNLIYFILIIAFLVRFYGIFIYYPYNLHPDESTFIDIFHNMYVNGDLNPHFFYSPNLLIYLTSFFNFIIMQFFNILGKNYSFLDYNFAIKILTLDKILITIFSTLTVYYVYKIGKKIWNKNSGLLAALVLTFSIAHINNSFYLWFDIPVTFFIVLSFYYFTELLKSNEPKNYIKIGISIGLAISTKYNAFILILFYIIVLIIISKEKKWIIFSKNELKFNIDNNHLKYIFYSFLIVGCVFLLFNPYSILSFNEFFQDFRFSINQMRGATDLDLNPNNMYWSYYFIRGILPGLSIFGTLLFLISIFLFKKNKSSILILLFILFFYFTNESFLFKAPRYLLPIFPFATLLIGNVLSKYKKLNLLLLGMIIITLIFLIQLYPETRSQSLYWALEHQYNDIVYTCAYSVPWAIGCNESLWWIENNQPAYYLISDNYYNNFFISNEGMESENYDFYNYILTNGELVEEFNKTFNYGVLSNPTVSIYWVE